MKHLSYYINESVTSIESLEPSNVFEAIPLSTYKGFLQDYDMGSEDAKNREKAKAYKEAFWKVLKMIPGAKENRNHHRIYIPFDEPVHLTANIEQAIQYAQDGYKLPVEQEVMAHIAKKLDNTPIVKWDYKDGFFSIEIDTQMGKKERMMKIGKWIADNKELLNAYSADPSKLTKNIEGAKKLICISDHAYDIAGMSTGRKWTSCMNIINGCNREYVMKDIEYGTLVAYLILEDDLNLEAPLGRVLIKPYKLARKDYHGTDPSPIVYSPEPTIYSTYVGMDGVIDYLNKICQEYQPYQGTLKKMKQVYYDTMFAKKDMKFN